MSDTFAPSDDLALVGALALAALSVKHPDCARRFVARLPRQTQRLLGELADTLSQIAFTEAGPLHEERVVSLTATGALARASSASPPLLEIDLDPFDLFEDEDGESRS